MERRVARQLRVGCEAASLSSRDTLELMDRSAAACCHGQNLEFRDAHNVTDCCCCYSPSSMQFSIRKSDGTSRRITDQTLTTWAIGLSNRKCPVRFCISGLHRSIFILRIEKYNYEARNPTAYETALLILINGAKRKTQKKKKTLRKGIKTKVVKIDLNEKNTRTS